MLFLYGLYLLRSTRGADASQFLLGILLVQFFAKSKGYFYVFAWGEKLKNVFVWGSLFCSTILFDSSLLLNLAMIV